LNREKLKKQLCENLRFLERNSLWLEKSFSICREYKFSSLEELSEEQLTNLEALSSRFGRSIDILIYKVLRNLDIYELEDVENKLDILIRAEKRGLVEDYEQLIEMKDLRNRLVHEYITDIVKIFKLVIQYTPKLLEVIKNTEEYIKITRRYCL